MYINYRSYVTSRLMKTWIWTIRTWNIVILALLGWIVGLWRAYSKRFAGPSVCNHEISRERLNGCLLNLVLRTSARKTWRNFAISRKTGQKYLPLFLRSTWFFVRVCGESPCHLKMSKAVGFLREDICRRIPWSLSEAKIWRMHAVVLSGLNLFKTLGT